MDYNSKISQHFTAAELIKSETAIRQGIDNRFRSDTIMQSAIALTKAILEPIRSNFGPFSPNSVYRCQILERALKHKPKSWISKSQHTQGKAADIEIAGLTNAALAQWASVSLDFDQLILEMYTPGVPASGWVHISYNGNNNRHELLTFNGKKYLKGLQV